MVIAGPVAYPFATDMNCDSGNGWEWARDTASSSLLLLIELLPSDVSAVDVAPAVAATASPAAAIWKNGNISNSF